MCTLLWLSCAAPVAEEVLPDHDERVARPGPARDGDPLRHAPVRVQVEPHGAIVAGARVPAQVEVVAAPEVFVFVLCAAGLWSNRILQQKFKCKLLLENLPSAYKSRAKC